MLKLGTWQAYAGSFSKKGKQSAAPASMSANTTADLMASVMSANFAKVVHAVAVAAADYANAEGMPEEKCTELYSIACVAASDFLNQDQPRALADATPAPPMRAAMSRVEQVLARSVQKHAVRVIDLFKDWDEDNNGVLSKREFRNAMQSVGLGASDEEVDAMFDKWDIDKSGMLEFDELNKAMRSGIAGLKAEPSPRPEDEAEVVQLLGRGKAKSGRMRELREAKAQAKQRREVLSPRSQELKDAAEKKKAAVRLEQEREDRKSVV